MNGYVVFYGGDASGNHGLWTTDGTALGTREIVPGTQGTQDLGPYNFISMGSYALFAGKDASGSTGLWATDGTQAGSSEILVGSQGTHNLLPGDYAWSVRRSTPTASTFVCTLSRFSAA